MELTNILSVFQWELTNHFIILMTPFVPTLPQAYLSRGRSEVMITDNEAGYDMMDDGMYFNWGSQIISLLL